MKPDHDRRSLPRYQSAESGWRERQARAFHQDESQRHFARPRRPGAFQLGWLLFPALLSAQSLTEWTVPPVLQSMGYSAEFRREGCHDASGCMVLLAPTNPPPGANGDFGRTFDAAPYRGRTIRLRAWIRLESTAPSDHAQMRLEVNLPGRQKGFSDNMADRPITTGEWTSYELSGDVAADAESIEIGVTSFGQGRLWVDGATFETLAATAVDASTRSVFRALYARIDAAYAQKDIDAIASFAMPTAEIHMGATNLPLHDALLQVMDAIQKGTRYASKSTVTNVRLSGEDAIVAVNNESTMTSKTGRQVLESVNRDTWTQTPEGWKLKESALLSVRSVIPPTEAEVAKPVVAELRSAAVPLENFAAFGRAIGEARFAAFGDAAHGAREFVQVKQRLLEYLVRQKGFTVLAVEANWPESLAVDRYIKNGEGDPKAALAALYGWRWDTREMLDVVEWMRSFNQAPGDHPTLTFTSFDMQVGHLAAQGVLDYLAQVSPADSALAKAAYTEALDLEKRRAQIFDDRAQAVADRAAAVVKLFDAKRAGLIAKSTAEAWRDARQAAVIVQQSCSARVPGKGPAYRSEMLGANMDWLSSQVYPHDKIVIWSDNGRTWLDGYGTQAYVTGFAFRRGQIRAIGINGGKFTAVGDVTVPASPEGSGDAILAAAGLPVLFLDVSNVPTTGALGQWLAQPHLFHNPGANWAADDPDSNLETLTPSRLYDGLIFVDEVHPTRPLEP